jgi:hypothetical protein
MTRSLERRDLLAATAVAGTAAAIGVALYAAVNQWQAGESLADTYVFFASVIGGTATAASPFAVPAGIVVLLAASLGWAYGYLAAARQQQQLLTRPLISGVGLGVVVWVVNQLVLVASNRFSPSLWALDRDLIGSILFFAIPLTLAASRLLRGR